MASYFPLVLDEDIDELITIPLYYQGVVMGWNDKSIYLSFKSPNNINDRDLNNNVILLDDSILSDIDNKTVHIQYGDREEFDKTSLPIGKVLNRYKPTASYNDLDVNIILYDLGLNVGTVSSVKDLVTLFEFEIINTITLAGIAEEYTQQESDVVYNIPTKINWIGCYINGDC